MTATWKYRPGTTGFEVREGIRSALVETFAGHMSRSVQHTLYAMGEAALAVCAQITEITLTMPNRHHLLVDLKPFGLDNPNEVFVATDQPFGLIEATIRRSGGTV
jgi:urate oxidase